MDKKLIDEWSRLYGRSISEEEYLEIRENLVNFFTALHRWKREEESTKTGSAE